MSEASEGVELVRQQRAALAQRVRLPWWYLVSFTVAILAALSLPLASWGLSSELSNWVVLVPALVVLLSLDRILGQATGARLSRRTLRAYPSSRPAGIAMLLIFIAAMLGEQVLITNGRVAVAVVVVMVAAVGVVACLVRQTAAIRDDIRAGRATTG